MRAIWNGTVIAESDDTVVVEGNHYSIEVDGQVNTDAAWYYPDTLPAADSIKGRVAFWKGVTVERG